jgi:cardiolipin synthase C
VINTDAGLYIESPELTERLLAYMANGLVPANSYRVPFDPAGEIVWDNMQDGRHVRYRASLKPVSVDVCSPTF